ncbi:MAG: hypothetical protein U0326_38380 [Polyangiales bacterium]
MTAATTGDGATAGDGAAAGGGAGAGRVVRGIGSVRATSVAGRTSGGVCRSCRPTRMPTSTAATPTTAGRYLRGDQGSGSTSSRVRVLGVMALSWELSAGA